MGNRLLSNYEVTGYFTGYTTKLNGRIVYIFFLMPAIKDIIVIQFILQAGNIMSIGFEKAYALQTDMNFPASEILST